MADNYDNGYFISEYYKPCCVCGKLTNKIEYNYEAYICSRDCENKMLDDLYSQDIRKGQWFGGEELYECSECGHQEYVAEVYCPSCHTAMIW